MNNYFLTEWIEFQIFCHKPFQGIKTLCNTVFKRKLIFHFNRIGRVVFIYW